MSHTTLPIARTFVTRLDRRPVRRQRRHRRGHRRRLLRTVRQHLAVSPLQELRLWRRRAHRRTAPTALRQRHKVAQLIQLRVLPAAEGDLPEFFMTIVPVAQDVLQVDFIVDDGLLFRRSAALRRFFPSPGRGFGPGRGGCFDGRLTERRCNECRYRLLLRGYGGGYGAALGDDRSCSTKRPGSRLT